MDEKKKVVKKGKVNIHRWWNERCDDLLGEEKPIRCKYCWTLYFPKEGCHCAAFALHQA